MLNNVLDFLFPPVCGVCGKIDKNWVCENCEKRIKRIERFVLIENLDKNFDKLIYVFNYEKLIRKLILRYKFSDKPYLSNFFLKIMLKNKKICKILKNYDIIIPVPMSIKKKRIRGYNQTDLIAVILGKELNKVVLIDGLLKIKETKTQSILKLEDRQSNVKDAFIVNSNLDVKNKKIVIFDDIYTTGATVDECSKQLKLSGANEILVLVIAKD